MSDNVLRLIPLEPEWVPDPQVGENARRLLQRLLPEASQVTIEVQDHVGFVDQGANFESVGCPACGASLDVGWWQAAMEKAMESQFADLAVSPPCCGARTSLNDLRYVWPAGFARFSLEAMNPNRSGDLDPAEIGQLEALLGCKLRQIWAHY